MNDLQGILYGIGAAGVAIGSWVVWALKKSKDKE